MDLTVPARAAVADTPLAFSETPFAEVTASVKQLRNSVSESSWRLSVHPLEFLLIIFSCVGGSAISGGSVGGHIEFHLLWLGIGLLAIAGLWVPVSLKLRRFFFGAKDSASKSAYWAAIEFLRLRLHGDYGVEFSLREVEFLLGGKTVFGQTAAGELSEFKFVKVGEELRFVRSSTAEVQKVATATQAS